MKLILFSVAFILPPSAFILSSAPSLAVGLPLGSESDALEDDGDALTAADAGRGEAVATAAALEFVKGREHESSARRAERVAEGDCAAVDVRLRAVEAEFTFDGEVLAGEGLVDFD